MTELEKIKQAIQLAADTFSFYAEYHESKGDETSLLKAKNNRNYAALQKKALVRINKLIILEAEKIGK